MRTPLTLAVIALALTPLAHAATTTPAFRSLIQAERGFAAQSRSLGSGPAFVNALADDGIVFGYGVLNGLDVYRGYDDPSLLDWAPEAGEIAVWGDFGYDFGPFTYTPFGTSTVYGGHYVTVWERDTRGTWKVAADDGINHAATPLPAQVQQRIPTGSTPLPPLLNVQRNARAQSLELADRSLVRALMTHPATAYNDVRASDCVFLRNGYEPLTGGGADAVLAAAPPRGLDSLEVSRLSFAGDLAFTAGAAPDAAASASTYLRIWRYTHSGWKLAVDSTH